MENEAMENALFEEILTKVKPNEGGCPGAAVANKLGQRLKNDGFAAIYCKRCMEVNDIKEYDKDGLGAC